MSREILQEVVQDLNRSLNYIERLRANKPVKQLDSFVSSARDRAKQALKESPWKKITKTSPPISQKRYLVKFEVFVTGQKIDIMHRTGFVGDYRWFTDGGMTYGISHQPSLWMELPE